MATLLGARRYKIQKTKLLLGLMSLVSIWLMLIYQLSITWETNVQYSHGFLAPILCFYLILKSQDAQCHGTVKKSFLQGKTWYLFGIPLLLALPLIWLIRGANTDWRLLNLVLFGITFILTLKPRENLY